MQHSTNDGRNRPADASPRGKAGCLRPALLPAARRRFGPRLSSPGWRDAVWWIVLCAMALPLAYAQQASAQSPSSAVCYVKTRGDLPKHAIVGVYPEVYVVVGVLNNLEERFKQHLRGRVNYEDELFPFENRCLMVDEGYSGSPERRSALDRLADAVVSDFRAGGIPCRFLLARPDTVADVRP